MAKRVFCLIHKQMCLAKIVVKDESKSWTEKGNIKYWKLRCGCIKTSIEDIQVHQGFFLRDGTQLVNPSKYKEWEVIPPKNDKI